MPEKCERCEMMPGYPSQEAQGHLDLTRDHSLDANPKTVRGQARAEVRGYVCSRCGTKWQFTHDRTDQDGWSTVD